MNAFAYVYARYMFTIENIRKHLATVIISLFSFILPVFIMFTHARSGYTLFLCLFWLFLLSSLRCLLFLLLLHLHCPRIRKLLNPEEIKKVSKNFKYQNRITKKVWIKIKLTRNEKNYRKNIFWKLIAVPFYITNDTNFVSFGFLRKTKPFNMGCKKTV